MQLLNILFFEQQHYLNVMGSSRSLRTKVVYPTKCWLILKIQIICDVKTARYIQNEHRHFVKSVNLGTPIAFKKCCINFSKMLRSATIYCTIFPIFSILWMCFVMANRHRKPDYHRDDNIRAFHFQGRFRKLNQLFINMYNSLKKIVLNTSMKY